MAGTTSLKTPRLSLRRHVPEDAGLLYQNFGTDAAMYRYSGWNPYATPEQARKTAQRFIDSYADLQERRLAKVARRKRRNHPRDPRSGQMRMTTGLRRVFDSQWKPVCNRPDRWEAIR